MFLFPECAGRLLLALVALCCASIAWAQPRLSADDAVERALSHESWQQEWQSSVEMARGDVTLARTLPNPSLLLSRETLADPAGGEETRLMLAQPLEFGGRRSARIRAAEAGLAVAEAASVRDQRQVRAEVLRAYYAAVAAEQNLQARATALTALEALAGVAETRRRGGDLSGYEARRIQQAAGQARAVHADTEAAVQAARAALAAWAGPDAATAILDERIPLPELPESPGEASLGGTDLAVAAAERARAEAELSAASSLSLPITVGLGRTRLRQGDWSDDALLLEVEVGLPLFDRRQGERAQARAALSLAEARHEREQRQLAVRRAALLEQARVLRTSAERITLELLPEATQLTALARASFAEGELDLVALLDAFEAEAALVERGLQDRLRALDAALTLESLMPSPQR